LGQFEAERAIVIDEQKLGLHRSAHGEAFFAFCAIFAKKDCL
jgi:hypothetical protein